LPHAVGLGSYDDARIEAGRRLLEDASVVAREAAPDVTTSTDLGHGSAAGHLIGMSATAGLVVLGSRGLGGFSGLVIGSIAVAVATHGQCPVVVVRGTEPRTTLRQEGPVVVGADGSPTSQAGIRFSFEAASLRDAPLVAVHAWSDVPLPPSRELASSWDPVRQQELEVLDQRLAESRALYPAVRVERVVVRDNPAHVLLDRAEDAQLVVVGSRGRGGFRGLLLGSTSQALIYHAACPVAVVPPPRT